MTTEMLGRSWINHLLTNDGTRVEADPSARTYLDNYLLLDSAASIHMFHSRDRFSNSRRAGRKGNLLCSQSIVKIERHGHHLLHSVGQGRQKSPTDTSFL